MSADGETLSVYDRDATAYADYARGGGPWLDRFLAMLAPDAHVLDLGAGPGWAAARIAASGRSVLAQDASAGLLAEAARRHGVPTRRATFDELDDRAVFDGVWASFCLLHVPRRDTPGNLARCFAALKPGGALYVGLKEGAGDARDRLGRFYAHYGFDELRGLLGDAGFVGIDIVRSPPERGFEGALSSGLHAYARRPA